MEIDFQRARAALEQLRALAPAAVPGRAFQSLYVHDDAVDALASVEVTPEIRAALPPDLVEELDLLIARARSQLSR